MSKGTAALYACEAPACQAFWAKSLLPCPVGDTCRRARPSVFLKHFGRVTSGQILLAAHGACGIAAPSEGVASEAHSALFCHLVLAPFPAPREHPPPSLDGQWVALPARALLPAGLLCVPTPNPSGPCL